MRENLKDQKNIMYVLMIDDLIRSIKDQNLEIVALRRMLVNCMKPKGRKNLQPDLYASLYPQTIPIPYVSFVQEDCNGNDPFEEAEYLSRMKRYATGMVTPDHPAIRLDQRKKKYRTTPGK